MRRKLPIDESISHLCIIDVDISEECIAGYECLARKLMPSYMLEKEAKVVLSKLILILSKMDNTKRTIINLYFGLESGFPIDSQAISNRLQIEKSLVYNILSSSYSFLRRRFYAFIQEKEPSLNFYLYNSGISSQSFRRMKDISLQAFMELSPQDLKKISKSNPQYRTLMLIQATLKKQPQK